MGGVDARGHFRVHCFLKLRKWTYFGGHFFVVSFLVEAHSIVLIQARVYTLLLVPHLNSVYAGGCYHMYYSDDNAENLMG